MRGQDRIILVGTNGTGKSTLAQKIVEASTHGEGRRALALLPDDSEPIFRPYNEIARSELKYINNVANKFNKIYFDNHKIFTEIERTFKNGVLVMDDAKFYARSRDEEMNKLYIRARQNNLDVLFICHGLSEIPPSLITYTTKIVLFNTVDEWQRLKSKIPNAPYFERIVNEIRTKASNHKFTLKQVGEEKVQRGEAFIDINTKTGTKGKPFKYVNRDGIIVVGVGCEAFSGGKCNCGAAYVKKIIDVKRDLILTSGF